MTNFPEWILNSLVSPVSGEPLYIDDDGHLASPTGEKFEVIDGVPHLLPPRED